MGVKRSFKYRRGTYIGMFSLLFIIAIVSVTAQEQSDVSLVNVVENVDDSEMLNTFTHLKGFKSISFDIQSSELMNKEVQREDVSVGRTIKHKYDFSSLEIESSYKEIDTSFFNTDTKPVKQLYVIKNLLDKPRELTLNIKHEIDASAVVWNDEEYEITETPRTFEAFYVEDKISPELSKPSLAGHTIYFGKSYYNFRDVVNLDYKVSVYVDQSKNYIDLEIQTNLDSQESFVIDPLLGWTTRQLEGPMEDNVYAIDINGDNNIDIVGAKNGEISWYENEGGFPLSFTERSITTTAESVTSIFAIDVDNDGNTDVLSATRTDDTIAWYENDGNSPPGWTERTITTGADSANDVFAIDLDKDGDIDVLSASGNDNTIAWYENDGGVLPSWTERTITNSLNRAISIHAIDVDKDGDIDVVGAASGLDESIAWYENDGSSPPSWTFNIIGTGSDISSVFAMDLDDDGDIDALSTSERTNEVMWYDNGGIPPFSFAPRLINKSNFDPSDAFAVDLDDDGDLDVVSAFDNSGSTAGVKWHENKGGSPLSWTTHTISSTANLAKAVYAVDIDSDGDVDVVAGSSEKSWYENDLNTNVCTGTIQTVVEDANMQGISGIKVFLESVLQGTTDGFGILNVNTPAFSCGGQQTLEVKCADDTFCASKEVMIDFPNELEGVTFDCTLCLGGADFVIGQEDVFITSSGSQFVVNATVHSVNLASSGDLLVRFQTIGSDGLIKDTFDSNVTIAVNGIASTTATFDLANKDFVTVYVDPGNFFLERKTNNFVRRSTLKRIKAYFDIDTGFSKVDEAITEFLEAFAEPVSLFTADVVIAVGRNSDNVVSDIVDNENFISTHGWGFRNEKVFADGQYLALPYNGVVGSYNPSLISKKRLVALGTSIDGTVAAVKKMASAGGVYFDTTIGSKPLLILDRHDLTALGVYDILHNSENRNSYQQNTENFKTAIAKTLGGNTFDVAIRLVNTTQSNNVTLRVKNVNSEFSQSYKDAVVEDPTPVVFSGGIFSDLEEWEDNGNGLAIQLAGEEGRDVWEIEMTGGPLIERNAKTGQAADPDYTYTDLVDEYWPASIAAIQYYTGKISTDYVGHSNGCRVALSSLNSYQDTGKSSIAKVQNLQTGNVINVHLQGSGSTPIVDTFVGVACPAELNDDTILSDAARTNVVPFVGPKVGNAAIALISDDHTTLRDYGTKMMIAGVLNPNVHISSTFLVSLFVGNEKISRNLMDFYNDLAIDGSSNFDVSSLTLNKLRLYYGQLSPLQSHDAVVPVEDMNIILNSVTSGDEAGEIFTGLIDSNHAGIKSNNEVKSKILEELK